MAVTAGAPTGVVHVELLGLQGAGKTTLGAAAIAAGSWTSIEQLEARERLRPRPLRRHRVATRALPERLRRRLLTGPVPNAKDAAVFAARHRSHVDTVFRAADEVADRSLRELAVMLLFESWSERAFADHVGRPGDAVLHHESVLQRAAFLLSLLPPGSVTADEVVAALPLPHGVVVLELPLETAVERVRSRGREFTMTEVMPSTEQHVAAIVARLRAEGVPLVVVDARQPTATSLPEVLAFLDRRRRAAR